MTSTIVPEKNVIVALDFPDASSTFKLIDQLDPASCRVKVGKELFARCGPALVEELVKREFDVFLDLKFHDIPNTVEQAVSAAAALGVWMVNVHASGGRNMMLAARRAVEQSQHKPLLIGVTVLTSMAREDLAEIGLNVSTLEQVSLLAKLVADCGLDGVVCSAAEAKALRQFIGPDFSLVTPGIRLAGMAADDQKRIVTPADALAAGSDYLVIGRPITQAESPQEQLNEIYRQMNMH